MPEVTSMFVRVLLAASLAWAVAVPAAAQTGVLTGRVTRLGSADPMGGAAVVIEELKREARTVEDGSYRFEGLTPGLYHVSVRAEGYSSRRAEVTIGAGAATLNLEVDLDLHFAEVLSVSPNPRPQFESYQPTSVLSAEDLARQLQDTIGATLQAEPGVNMRSLGPGPARPVIRGLDGDRVLVMQDGQRMGDLSSQSGDHGVPVNPASAQRIEVVRGPATLLYGANAIGGLVNVVTDQIPSEKVTAPTGTATFNLGSNNLPAGAAADVHVGNGRFAMHFGGGGQRSDSYHTPQGEVDNSQSRSGFVNVGGGWTGERQYAGVSYGYDDTRYGVPVLEEGLITLTPRRHAFSARAGGQGLSGVPVVVSRHHRRAPLRPPRARGRRRSTPGSRTTPSKSKGWCRTGRSDGCSGSFGGWLLDRKFSAEGRRRCRRRWISGPRPAFFYEELTWPHFTHAVRRARRSHDVRAGRNAARSQLHRVLDLGRRAVSVRRPPATTWWWRSAWLAPPATRPSRSCTSSATTPATSRSRSATPTSTRRRRWASTSRSAGVRTAVQTSVTVFRNRVSTTSSFATRCRTRSSPPARTSSPSGSGSIPDDLPEGEFPYVEFIGTDATMWGAEAHADVTITDRIGAELHLRLRAGLARRGRRAAAADSASAAHRRASLHPGPAAGRRQRHRRGRQDRVYGTEDRDRVLRPAATLRHLHAAVDALGADADRPARQRHQHALPESPELHQGRGAGDGPGIPRWSTRVKF